MNANQLMKQVISSYGKQLQTFVAIEEMAELMKELTKNMRGEDNHAAVLEEVADVYIMLEQIKIMQDIPNSELHGMIARKLYRLEQRMKGVKPE